MSFSPLSLLLRAGLSLFLCFYCGGKLMAQLPEDFFQEPVAEFQLPVGVTVDDRGYTYVWEKAGVVWLLDSNEVRLPTPFLDLSEEVAEWRDHGLLGFALDPDFLFNGYVYCAYTVDRHHLFNYGTANYSPDSTITNEATIGRITRFTADTNQDFTVAPYDTRKVLLGETIATGIPIPNNLHGVGSLAFGDDGSLLASTGDGGPDFQPEFAGDFHIQQAIAEGIVSPAEQVGPFRAQLLQGLNGKILRLDPRTGAGLPDNPFYNPDQPTAAESLVWTLGIRNPYRMATIPGSGSHEADSKNPGIIVFGDVGEGLWEEINFVTGPGLNCGWPIYEGLGRSGKWAGQLRENVFAPNPLANNADCNQAFFHFQNLLLPANAKESYFWLNPCDNNQLIPDNIPSFSHHWPVVEYSNQMFNQPTRAQTAIFDEDGNKVVNQLPSLANPIRGHNFDGFSAMAGFWYEEGPLPEYYHRTFWVADYSGWIKYLTLDENYQVTRVDTFTTFDHDIVDLAFNHHNQSIYFVDISEGRLYKIAYGIDPPPVIQAEPAVMWGPSPLTVQFDASASFHPKGLPFTYAWDFGDGESSTEVAPSHTYIASGAGPESFTATLRLRDSLGIEAEKQILISLNNTPPQVQITSVQDGDLYPITGYTSLPLNASVSDAEHQEIDLAYEWQTFLHHNAHFHPEPVDTLRQTYTLIDPLGCDGELYYFRLQLSVTDPQGLRSSQELLIHPNCNSTMWEVNLAAEEVAEGVRLTWQLDAEQMDDLRGIVIQRVSSKAEDWGIGRQLIDAQSYSDGNFSFTDNDPLQGINQYRLLFEHQNETYDYSNFTNILYPTPPPLLIYPNPATSELNLQITQIKGRALSWRILNNRGRVERSGIFPDPGTDFVFEQIDLEGLSNGAYFIELMLGEDVYTEPLVIQR